MSKLISEPYQDFEEVCEYCKGKGRPKYGYSGYSECWACCGKGVILSDKGEEFIEFLKRHFEEGESGGFRS